MAIQWADDFSRYGTGSASNTAMLDGLPYANVATGTDNRGTVQADPSTSITGRAFLLPPGAAATWQNQFRLALPNVVSSGTGRILCRMWQVDLPTMNVERPTIGFQRGDNTPIVYASIEQNGSVTVMGRVAGVLTEIADTVNPVTSPSSWQHYEFEHNKTTGAGAFYVNGVQRLTWSGVDTADALEFAQITAAQGNTLGRLVYIKDLVIADSSGTENTGTIGTVFVRRLKPNADIALGAWVPSTGTTGFNLLAKDAVNDTTYLSANDTLPSADMRFDMENLPPDITSVRALITVVRSRKIDGGDGNLQTAISPDGTNWDNGADRPITPAFQYDFDVSELSPATATAWNPIEVDDLELRIDRTA